MKSIKARPEFTVTNVRFLILIYALLCVLTVLFLQAFFIDVLENGRVPERLNLIVFFTIPSVLMIIFTISAIGFFWDIISKRRGNKFQTRLLIYFIIIVVLTITPITVITNATLNEIIRFWQSINTSAAASAANSFIANNYILHLERFENIIRQNTFPAERLPPDIASVQEFRPTEKDWEEIYFLGNEEFKLTFPPSAYAGFPVRELPRDRDTIRFIQRTPQNTAIVISYYLGSEFDQGRSVLENQAVSFETINLLRENLLPLLFIYYLVFSFPTLLMTVIIAISFTRRITQPIVELTEATRRVAEGDFSIQMLSRRNDELGVLVRDFNTMVHDLEKARTTLVKAEKISIWQNMAQQLAHEIKNPLTPIKLSAERVLRRWQNSPEKINEILESSMMAIIQETEGLSVLLNEFRTLSKPQEPSKTWAGLKEPIEELINIYSSSYPKIKFNVNHTQNNVIVKIDKHRFSQILANLIINAIDSMNNKGSIEITSDLVKKGEIYYCRISVKDSGKGMSKENGQLVFTPYFTTKDSGTGLGLPIVERIINDHQGTIWFDSAQGVGTTFYFDLPAEGEDNVGDTDNR